jgi:hypothetical protein
MTHTIATASTEQIEVCARFRSDVVPADPNLKVGIALATLTLLPLNAVRMNEENGTCGWYIYGGEYSDNPEFYQPLHVAHLAKYCPQIIPYLALAPGWRVLLAPDYEDVWFDGESLHEPAA